MRAMYIMQFFIGDCHGSDCFDALMAYLMKYQLGVLGFNYGAFAVNEI